MTTAIMEMNNAGEVQNAEKTFEMFVEEWLAARVKAGKKKALKTKTISTYRYSLKVFKKWLDAENISQPSEKNIESWKAAMDVQINPRTGQPWTPATKNLYLASVRSFYSWLANKYGVVNVTAGFEGWENTKEHKRGFLSLIEMKRLMSVVEPVTQRKLAKAKSKSRCERIILQGRRDKAILAALMAGGLRAIEISRLRVADFTNNAGCAYLNVLGKGKVERVLVKISAQAESIINEWLAAREGVDVVADDSPLFCSVANNSFGEEISSHAISILCKEYLTEAGLKNKKYQRGNKIQVKPIVAHSLRGSLATNSYLNGATLDQVKQQLRHENISTTLRYIDEAEKSLNPCSDIISSYIF